MLFLTHSLGKNGLAPNFFYSTDFFCRYIQFCWIKLSTFSCSEFCFILQQFIQQNKSLETMRKPKFLDIEPSSPTAAKDYCHWWAILLNYIDFHDKIPNKYQALLSCIGSRVFEYIKGYTDFEVAIEKLDALFIKTPNEVFARHLLAMRRQKPGKSWTKIFRELEKLKNCNFKDHTAEECGNKAMCDAFISSLS